MLDPKKVLLAISLLRACDVLDGNPQTETSRARSQGAKHAIDEACHLARERFRSWHAQLSPPGPPWDAVHSWLEHGRELASCFLTPARPARPDIALDQLVLHWSFVLSSLLHLHNPAARPSAGWQAQRALPLTHASAADVISAVARCFQAVDAEVAAAAAADRSAASLGASQDDSCAALQPWRAAQSQPLQESPLAARRLPAPGAETFTYDAAYLVFQHIPNSDTATCRSVARLSRRLAAVFFATRRRLRLQSALIASWCTDLEELTVRWSATSLAVLQALPVPSKLRRLSVATKHPLGADDVVLLSRFVGLRSLSVRNDWLLRGGVFLSHAGPLLEELDVSGWRDPWRAASPPLTRTFARLRRCANLRVLAANSANLRFADLTCLPASMVRLELARTGIQGPLDLSYLTNLQQLKLSSTRVEELRSPPSLLSLEVDRCPQLRPARLTPPAAAPADAPRRTPPRPTVFENLRSLVANSAAALLPSLPHLPQSLTRLEIAAAGVEGDLDLRYLKKLKLLDVARNKGLTGLRAPPSLLSLDISSCAQLSNESFWELELLPLRKLTRLVTGSVPIYADDLAVICIGLPRLVELELPWCDPVQRTDHWRFLTALSALTKLDLCGTGCAYDDEFFEILGRLTTLKWLNAGESEARGDEDGGDGGGDEDDDDVWDADAECLRHLSQLTNLERLDVAGYRWTEMECCRFLHHRLMRLTCLNYE